MIGSFTVITEIVPRAYTNFKDATFGGREQSLPIRCKVSLPHRHVDKVGQDSILIDTHVSFSLATSLSGDSQIGCDECPDSIFPVRPPRRSRQWSKACRNRRTADIFWPGECTSQDHHIFCERLADDVLQVLDKLNIIRPVNNRLAASLEIPSTKDSWQGRRRESTNWIRCADFVRFS